MIHIERVDGNHYFGPHFWIKAIPFNGPQIFFDTNFIGTKFFGPTHCLNRPKVLLIPYFFGRMKAHVWLCSAQLVLVNLSTGF